MSSKPEPGGGNPHGWFGYVVSDRRRTDNAIRLGRSVALCTLVVMVFGGMAVAAVAAISPMVACGLISLVTAGVGAMARRRGRRS